MDDVKNLLITILESFEYPVYLQGSLSKDQKYPDSFFTFWNNSTTDDGFYDNNETKVTWDFDVNFYSNDPVLVNGIPQQLKTMLKAAGFIPEGSGYDVVSDEPTHTGRGMNILFIQKVRY